MTAMTPVPKANDETSLFCTHLTKPCEQQTAFIHMVCRDCACLAAVSPKENKSGSG